MSTLQSIEAKALAFAVAVLSDGEQAANFVETRLAQGDAFVTAAQQDPIVKMLADAAFAKVKAAFAGFATSAGISDAVATDAMNIEHAAANLLADLAAQVAQAPTVAPAPNPTPAVTPTPAA